MPSGRSGSGSRGRRRRLPAEVPVVQVASSSSEEEGGSSSSSEEEDESESEGSGAGAIRRPGGARRQVSAGGAEGEGSRLPSCPICMNEWTADGEHRVSCIPCGHVYGRCCLERWLQNFPKKKAPCPQCSRKYKQNHIINLYVPEIAVPNNDLEKQVMTLREKNETLEKQQTKLLVDIKQYKRQISMQQNVISESNIKKQKVTEQSSDGTTNVEPTTSLTEENNCDNLCSFVLQNEFFLEGYRVMAIDASSHAIFTSGRATGFGTEHVLTKISMFAGWGMQKIQLPPDINAIRDICILPGGHAVFTSLGRKLSLVSMATNKIDLQYDLPVPGWSCSGDHTSSTHIYAGLQVDSLISVHMLVTDRRHVVYSGV